MELIISLMGSGFTGASLVTLIIGALVGWAVPQPAWADKLVTIVCTKLKLDKFHKDGHAHSDTHEKEEVAEDVKTDECVK